jgi:hypothetical protein
LGQIGKGGIVLLVLFAIWQMLAVSAECKADKAKRYNHGAGTDQPKPQIN